MANKQSIREKIVARERLDFNLDSSIPKYWFRDDAFKSRILDGFQLTFPDGERYFIVSVRAFRDRIQDPTLAQEVKEFIRQEGQHGMAHSAFNALLQDQGLPINEIIKVERTRLDGYTKRFSPEFNLALTAAFEHFTALMAECFFAKAEVMEGADRRVKSMLAWHAVEEMEHRSVAFDVMTKVVGIGYWTRTAAMAYAMKETMSVLYRLSDKLLKADGYGFWQRIGLHIRNFNWMYGPKGVFSSLTPHILAYFKPGFHPEDIPTMHNYPDWVEVYESTGDPLLACDALVAAAS